MKQKPELRCVGGTQVSALSDGLWNAMNAEAGSTYVVPNVAKKSHRAGLEALHSLLGEMFEKADDVFFDYAQKAGSNQEQDQFIETMRNLRLQRKEIERGVYQHVNGLFRDLPNPDAASNRSGPEKIVSLDALSLVNNDDLEMDVAMETMVSKVRNACGEALYQLNMRLDAIMMQVNVTDQNNPLHPRHVCEAFKRASRSVECPIRERLIIFKLFDKFVMSQYRDVLDAANACLAEAGVLPDLRGTPRRQPAASTSASASAPITQEDSREVVKEAATEFFGQLQSLMASVRNVPATTAVVSGLGGAIGSQAANARVVTNAELMSLLSGMQQLQPMGQDVATGRFQLNRMDLRDVLGNVLMQREGAHGPEKVADNESDVIGLVSMLFDFILDDDNLPVPVKALVGRLQIPVLKVAIKDKGFFNRSGHAARKLLNELARAGIGLTEDADQLQKDMVFKKIQSTVQRVLNEFTDDLALFDELLHDFNQFMQSEVRRSQMIEQRTRAAEEGKAKAELAEKMAFEVIGTKLENRDVPDVVERLLSVGWSGVLKLMFLKYGEESTNWQGAVKTIDHLLLSVTPPAADAERKRLFNVIPVLQRNLRQGLDAISFNPFEMGEMLTALEQVQMRVLRGETPELQGSARQADPVSALVDAVSEDIERMSATPMMPRKAAVAPLALARSQRAGTPAVELPALPDSDPWLAKVKQLKVGAWFEFRAEGGMKIRAKLAAHIKSADRMIFVNRTGVKIDEKSTLGVAHALKNGEVLVIEDSQLFDRALESVIGNLRKVRETSL